MLRQGAQGRGWFCRRPLVPAGHLDDRLETRRPPVRSGGTPRLAPEDEAAAIAEFARPLRSNDPGARPG